MSEKSLWWSSFEIYQKCGQRFLWRYGQPGVDLGAGEGKPKPKPGKKSEHHAVLGTVIQYTIECLYNDLLWVELVEGGADGARERSVALVHKLKDITVKKLQDELDNRYIKWSDYGCPSQAEMEKTCLAGVMGFLRTMKAHRLTGPYVRAEKSLTAKVGDVAIGAKMDLVIRRDPLPGVDIPLVGVTILDGKNSKYKGTYSDPDQLRWYALVFYLNYQVLPDRIGFVYYRFPYGTPIEGSDEVEQGIEWIPLELEDLQGLAQRILEVRKGIRDQKFEANPVPKECKWCDWEDVCPQRQIQKSANRAKRKKKVITDEDLGLPSFEPDGEGIQEIG